MSQIDTNSKLPRSFYLSDDVVALARNLLGCRLWSRHEDNVTAGIIVETEAYDGLTDRATHAFGGRRTPRTEIFYHSGGCAYTYLCYGIHTLFNIITGPEEVPQAILIRALKPVYGIKTILERRNQTSLKRNTAGGPGLVSQALGITREDYGVPLDGDRIWLTPAKSEDLPDKRGILATPRVGIDYAGDDARLPWRFRIANSGWTSPAK
ncbi:DNA-3-methyladenine glycosylase [Natronogracilivirga saccharolytica]|uniref:Putative 3-methyladenine DNA glycosylase n=1 Tax=Natronogracilivirga saccharolytica TaxID=2812953 RepID=A0A8J7UT02_9BACT|nr:DNA-3-methyladenine glycosylase [Natronogracilivirga saccharolytica]MBP3192111.1 DNA-3-methyladenine glycosylase [Natronogracilivirga saccharolytica]